MAQDQSLREGRIDQKLVVRDASVGAGRERSRQAAASGRLRADVAEALFDVHRLEAIVEDLAIVVARIGRKTVGIDDVNDRLDHLERTFGT